MVYSSISRWSKAFHSKISSLSKCEGTDNKKWTNCQGTYVGENKYIYVGEWERGMQNGKGIELWGDEKKYIE